ncbi:hypothetical protein [Pseudomonas sp. PSKL.D1]|uniref:hypothetical protein n=1 Tax=Pseudomonas sp. PSKL.D1 TaxID=3029060 RepID=UPI002380F7A8|nr:hypothetical protein [Pseudomonas sp. PSKL.D1]WDY60354.1 hypothetical protein PVV54_12230 [Pseudomonas sp. PSKL.D1]
MAKEARSTNTEKLAILPMWVIDRIKAEMSLGPAAWAEINKAVEAAEVPQVTPCAVKLPPATTFGAGVSVASLLMAIKQRAGFKPEFLEFTQPAPQPNPEPIAWMVGTAFWWNKEEAERDAAETGLPVVPVGPLVSIPDGYCLMPKRLTAENGAKALLLGEFKLEVTQECPECRELDEAVEGCEICDGEGEYGQRHIIPWDKIKYIYSEAVRGLAIQPNTTR